MGMLRNDHKITIEQNVSGADHDAAIRLSDHGEYFKDGFWYVTGSWAHTNRSYNGTRVNITTSSPEHLIFTWVGAAHGGVLNIGEKFGRASHREADGKEVIEIIISLWDVQRTADGMFKLSNGSGPGAGDLKRNVNPHFNKGEIAWRADYAW